GRHREAHAAIDHERRTSAEASCQQREGPSAALVSMNDVDPLTTEEAREPHGADGISRTTEEVEVCEAGRGGFGGPPLARPRDDRHAVATRRQSTGEVAELDGGAGIEVALRVDLEQVHGAFRRPRGRARGPGHIARAGLRFGAWLRARGGSV